MSQKDNQEKIREAFREKNAKDWNPIVVELPYFGPDNKEREALQGLTRVYAECGYEVAHMLQLRFDENLCKEAMELSDKIDAFRKRAQEASIKWLGRSPHNVLLDSLVEEDKKKPN